MDDKVKQAYMNVQISEESKKRIFNQIICSNKEQKTKKYHMNYLAKVAVFAMCLIACSGTIYAAYRLLSARDVASMFGEETLADKFDELSEEVVSAENDIYRASFLGDVSGKKLCNAEIDAEDEKTYFVVAVERIDNQAITYEEDLVISPFVKGVEPWRLNIYSMDGNATRQIIDNVLYCLYECENLEIFADKGVYLGVTEGSMFAEAYIFDSVSGDISRNEAYEGLNLLFELEIDSSKADSEKAEQYLRELEGEYSEESEQYLQEIEGEYSEETDVEDMESKIEMDMEEYARQKNIEFMENGRQDLKNPEEVIAKSTLIDASVMELQENDEGYLPYDYDDVSTFFSAKAVRKHGIDTITFYDDTGMEMVKFVVVEYKGGKYIAKMYECRISVQDFKRNR